MPDKSLKKLERQEDRQIRKQAKADVKDYKLGQEIASEAKDFGVDLSQATSGPTSQQIKEKTVEQIKKTAPQEYLSDFEQFTGAYKAPQLADRPELKEEQLKKLRQQEKRAKIFDYMKAVGYGLAGRKIDPSDIKSRQLRSEREAQYKQFRDTGRENVKRAEDWEYGFRKDWLNYLDNQIKDKRTSELDKVKLEKLRAEIKGLQARTEATRKPKTPEQEAITERQYVKGTRPYSSALESMTPDIESLLPPKADGKPYTSLEREDEARKIILQMYDIKYDEKKNPYLVPKEGAEGYLDTARSNVEIQKKTQAIDNELDMAKMELEAMGDQGTSFYEVKDKPKRKALEEKIADLELQKEEILSGAQQKSPAPKTTPTTQTGVKTPIDDILDEL